MLEPRPAATAATDHRDGSYVDWSPVLAGALGAAALFLLLSTFGAAVGLAVISPWAQTGASATAFGIGAAIWFLLIQVASFGVGGYLAGRMRRRWHDATQDEVDFRDGAHGFLVWATGFMLSVVLVMWPAASALQGATQGGSSALAAGAMRTTSADPLSTATDALFRTSSARSAQEMRDVDARGEATRILASNMARGELPAADRTYLAQLVAQRTGLNPQEAERRVNETIAQAKLAADQARKTTVLTGFLIGASLLVSLAAAWLAACIGGQHRDQGTVWRPLRRDFRPRDFTPASLRKQQ